MDQKILHRHHIIPKHVGGTDDPENIVLLTIEEHAEAHRKLWEKYGRWQDRIAWLGLAKLLSHEELLLEIYSQRKSEEWKRNNGERMKKYWAENPRPDIMAKMTERAREKSKGKPNPEHGRRMRQMYKDGIIKKYTGPSAFKEKHHTEESKKLLSESVGNRPKACCLKCHKPNDNSIHPGQWTCHIKNHHRDC